MTRSSGSPEILELEPDGDVVHVPHRLLTSDDVIGMDVEVVEVGARGCGAAGDRGLIFGRGVARGYDPGGLDARVPRGLPV